MFLTRRDRSKAASPKRQLLSLLAQPTFRWLWTPDIIDAYERGANAVEADERIIRRAEFNRVGLIYCLVRCNLNPRRRIIQDHARCSPSYVASAAVAERDLEDAIWPVRLTAKHTF